MAKKSMIEKNDRRTKLAKQIAPRRQRLKAIARDRDALPEDRFAAFLSVPVLSRGRLVGVINLQNSAPHPYSQREIRLVSTIGFLVGAEIEMARLESENSQLSEQLETRKLVERAKAILQRDLRIAEPEAYKILQRQSQQRRKSMKEIADAIVLSDAVKQDS